VEVQLGTSSPPGQDQIKNKKPPTFQPRVFGVGRESFILPVE